MISIVPVGCGAGQFLCDNGDCISKAMHCDGILDCGDASDERHCDDDGRSQP